MFKWIAFYCKNSSYISNALIFLRFSVTLRANWTWHRSSDRGPLGNKFLRKKKKSKFLRINATRFFAEKQQLYILTGKQRKLNGFNLPNHSHTGEWQGSNWSQGASTEEDCGFNRSRHSFLIMRFLKQGGLPSLFKTKDDCGQLSSDRVMISFFVKSQSNQVPG